MLVVIRHGDDEKVLLNADCKICILLCCLRRKCHVSEPHQNIDLVDEDGNLQNLIDMNQHLQCSKFLKERSTYVLVSVKKQSRQKIVEPLLLNWMPQTIFEISREKEPAHKGGRRKSSVRLPKTSVVLVSPQTFNE